MNTAVSEANPRAGTMEWYETVAAITASLLTLFGVVWGSLVTYRRAKLDFATGAAQLEHDEVESLRDRLNEYQADTRIELEALKEQYRAAIVEIAELRAALGYAEEKVVLLTEMNSLLANQNRLLVEEKRDVAADAENTRREMHAQISDLQRHLSALEERSEVLEERTDPSHS